jgi:ABC-type sugar transport system ATPase subunit
VTDWRPADRGIGFVPQDGALFSTMSVRDHLGFALRIRKRPRREIRERAEELAEMLGISPLLDRGPQGLSGGERQRVSLGRALAFRPDILCLDEPLSALDEETRDSLCELLRRVARQTGVTTVHITHSRTEALALADRLLVLEHGTVRAEILEREDAPAKTHDLPEPQRCQERGLHHGTDGA